MIDHGPKFSLTCSIDQSDAKRIIAAADALIRQKGYSHRHLAEATETDPAVMTLFLTSAWPADWEGIAYSLDSWLDLESRRQAREDAMPVMTPIVQAVLGMASVLKEDGGIGLIQGDSGIGKTESIRAVALRHSRSITIQASTARARPKPMLEDIGSRLRLSYCSRDTADTYRMVCERVRHGCDLLIVDEVHKYIGKPDCLHVLADLLKETAVPQLWTATGDLRRYLDRKVGIYRDPFAQIRSRITHQLDLNEIRSACDGILDAGGVREIARRKFSLAVDADGVRELVSLAKLDDEGGVRLVENVLKHAKRAAIAGKLDRVDLRIIRQSMDRSLTARTKQRLGARKITPVHPAGPHLRTGDDVVGSMPAARSKVG